MPSFAQGPICLGGYWNGSACIFPSNPPNNNPWNGSGSSANNPHPWSYQCSGIGCDSADDYDDYMPQCDSNTKSDLRQRKANVSGCIGRPGPIFDTDLWRENEGLTIWEWLNAPVGLLYYGIWNYADFALDVLALTLISNNSDMNAAYSNFSRALYDECIDNFPNDMNNDDFNHCMRNAYFLLENYPTSDNLMSEFVNWRLGTSLDVTDYSSSWAGKFTRDITNYQSCKEIYQTWDNDDCSGSL